MNLDTSHSARAAAGAQALHGTRHTGSAVSTTAGAVAGLSFLNLLGGAQDALGSDASALAVAPLASAPSAADSLPWLGGLPMAAPALPARPDRLKADADSSMADGLSEAAETQPTSVWTVSATVELPVATTDQTSTGNGPTPSALPDMAMANLFAMLPAGSAPQPAQALPVAVTAPSVRGLQPAMASARGSAASVALPESAAVAASAARSAVAVSPGVAGQALPVTEVIQNDATTTPGAHAASSKVSPVAAGPVQPFSALRSPNQPVLAKLVAASPQAGALAAVPAPDAPTPEPLSGMISPSLVAPGNTVAALTARAEPVEPVATTPSGAPVMPAVSMALSTGNATPVAAARPMAFRALASQETAARSPAPVSAVPMSDPVTVTAATSLASQPEAGAVVQPAPAVVIQVSGTQEQAPARTTVQMFGVPPATTPPASTPSASVMVENTAPTTALPAAAEVPVPAPRSDLKPSGPSPVQDARALAQRTERLADASAVVGRAMSEPASDAPASLPGLVAAAQVFHRETGPTRSERPESGIAALDNSWRASPANLDSGTAGTGAGVAPERAVADQIQSMVSQNVKNADFQIDLGGQGKVDVSISMSGTEAQVEFRSDQAQTRDWLGQTLSQLDELLRREGLVLSGASVGTSAGQSGQAFQPPVATAERQDRSGLPVTSPDPANAGQPPRRSVAAQGMVDLYA